MTQTLTNQSIALSSLTIHPANVRAQSGDTISDENIATLKASIRTLGLMQPLLVQKIGKSYGVLAGRRRHAALKALAEDGDAKGFTAKMKIECRIVPADCDVTTALSLAENITQQPMNAIDEFEAFARMMEVDGQTPEEIAQVFGATVASVKERLRYGVIHEDIRAAVRAKTITLDTMKAFANHPSKDVQLEVYEALTRDGDRPHAYAVRQALSSRGVQVSDALGELVKAEYEERGGAVAADLMPEHSVLEDQTLVSDILNEKLQAAAEDARAIHGFAWADVMEDYDWNSFAPYGRVYPGPIEPDEAGQTNLDEITKRIDEIASQMEAEDLEDDLYAKLDSEYDTLEDQARSLQEAYSDEDLKRAGVMAYWNGSSICTQIGLIRPEDIENKQGTNEAATETSKAGDTLTYNNALQIDLKAERARALGAALAQHPETALDVALFNIVTSVMDQMISTRDIKVSASKEYFQHSRKDEVDDTARVQIDAAWEELDVSWLADDLRPDQSFATFRALPQSEKARLVAYVTAQTTQPCFARDPKRDPLMASIEAEVMPDVRAHWRPNAALFARFKKQWLLNILSDDLLLKDEALNLAAHKKADIVDFLDKLFNEPFATLTAEQLAAVEAWTPPMMQTTALEREDSASVEGQGGQPEQSPVNPSDEQQKAA